MADEEFHEIHLSGKQLVFLFMLTTVVAVVIFLCGVMVGRGVRAQRVAAQSGLPTEAVVDPTDAARPGTPPVDPPSTMRPSTEGASPATQEKLSYPERLAAETPPPEALKEPAARSKPAPTPNSATPSPQPSEAATALAAEPAGDGFAVQVAAVRERGEATTIASRLTNKGYPAYVMAPATGAPRVYRVRVGKFKDRRQAERVADRLEKEEQFKPWIIR